jgi:predicted NBD/HSP70 family sugar kinase
VVAVHIQAESVLVADARLGGRLGPVTEVALPRPPDPEAVMRLVADLVAQQLDAAPDRRLGVGVAMVSPVGDDGSALAALPLAWPTGVPLQQSLQARLAGRGHRLPVSVGNDANLAGLAEYRHGAGAGAGDLLYLTTGQRGVGGALVVHGRLHTGSAGYALEVGHLTVRPGGRPCHCGNAGCLDVEADPTALSAHQQRLGDRTAAMRAIVPPLATGLAGLVNVFNPDRIVLGGLHAELLATAGDVLRGELASRSFLNQAGRVDVVAGELPRPELAGAAEVAFQPLLDDPRGTVLAR